MKRILLLIIFFLVAAKMDAQITITSADMPVSGDTLRYSVVSPVGSTINLGDSGASFTWDYSALTPVSQAVDTYKTALTVSLTYLLISFNAYGYKVADSLPGLGSVLPVSVHNVYTFFEKIGTTSYDAVAFAAQIAGLPTPFNYTKNDTWYFFPLNYLNNDSSNYSLTIGLASLGSLKETGYRKTRVDGWGTIATPYHTTPVNCIRVRSEIHEIDSIGFGTTMFGLPRNTVEYKWLVNGGHYPALWVTTTLLGTTETITSIRYRDIARDIPTAVPVLAANLAEVKVWPNPATDGVFNLSVPFSWNKYLVEVYDVQSRRVFTAESQNVLNLTTLPQGEYLARITSGAEVSYLKLVR